jgi:hypothetical protein
MERKSPAPVREPDTAEAIRARIDSMPPRERARLFELLAHHPENEPVRNLIKLIRKRDELYQLRERAAALRQLIAEAKYQRALSRSLARSTDALQQGLEGWHETLEQLEDSVPKRGMSKERIETAQEYLRLLEKYEKQTRALDALVKLPDEREKEYAKKYRESGDLEALRQYVKSLMHTYDKHKERARKGKALGTPAGVKSKKGANRPRSRLSK